MRVEQAISKVSRWLKQLEEKPFLEFPEAEQKMLKADYLRIEVLATGYVAGNPEIVELFSKLKDVLYNQEGFFWEYV